VGAAGGAGCFPAGGGIGKLLAAGAGGGMKRWLDMVIN
jgi:hypothetical protein